VDNELKRFENKPVVV